jgi:hypothetical protein
MNPDWLLVGIGGISVALILLGWWLSKPSKPRRGGYIR